MTRASTKGGATVPGASVRRIPRQRRAKATVDAILTATAQLLGHAGLSRLSTNRIAERAGVSIGSVYQYFPDKKELLRALIRRERELVREVTVAALGAAERESFGDAVARVVRAVLEHQRARAHIHDALFHDAARWLGEEQHAHHASRRRVEDAVATFLTARAAEVDVSDPRRAALVVVQTVTALAHESIAAPRREVEGETLIAEVTRMIVRYLARPRP
jgi:AcrR family transcriptional regulator